MTCGFKTNAKKKMTQKMSAKFEVFCLKNDKKNPFVFVLYYTGTVSICE